MEIQGGDGSVTVMKPGSKLEWGRGSGFKIDDRTVSRRHVEFHLGLPGEPRVGFVVLGKNPIWVHRRKIGKVTTFRTFEKGEMGFGDMFCVSAKNPIWFTCKNAELQASRTDNEKRELGLEGELAESLGDEFEMKGFDASVSEAVDISHIDPAKDFGFLVIGEEFNSYPKRMIKEVKNWNWFLDERREESEDDEFGEDKRKKKGGRRKRKKGGENEDDEDWTGESEGEKELITIARPAKKTKYSTRSKDHHKLPKDAGNSPRSARKKATRAEDEDDETLGGFIVDDDELQEEEEEEEQEEEEGGEFDEEEFDD